ncbi:MAG TPA: hypothetical protein VGJ21_17160 [Terracidiphilus sp.]|jgi:hypothetical protein
MARKSSSSNLVRFVIGALIVAAIYFFVIRKQWTGPAHEEHSRREVPREQERPKEERGPAPQVACESRYFAEWREPAEGVCGAKMRNGYPVPDAKCTPGGVNPSVTADVLHDPAWRTKQVRNCAESEAQKHAAYGWYDIAKPRVNSNENQVCELDHLVPLELGGADGMGNIWPECGPDGVTLKQRYFKQKDEVENYLAEEVRAGRIPLADAQRGIARDWTQYLNDADMWCGRTGKC